MVGGVQVGQVVGVRAVCNGVDKVGVGTACTLKMGMDGGRQKMGHGLKICEKLGYNSTNF